MDNVPSPHQFIFNPASYLQPNQWFRVQARGIISNTSTPNLTLGVYLGGTDTNHLAIYSAAIDVAS